MRIVIILTGLIYLTSVGCKSYECKYLINKSQEVSITEPVNVCNMITLLSNKKLHLYYYIIDTLPGNVQEDKIKRAILYKTNSIKGAVVFVSALNKKFTVLFHDSLYSEKFLDKKYLFEKSVYDNLKFPFSDSFFIKTTKSFDILFSEDSLTKKSI